MTKSFQFTKIKDLLNFIKFEHSVFALPFALSGAFLAKDNPPALDTILWIVLAMVGARSFAMAINRIIDRDIDSENPRTQIREIPQGKIKLSQAIIFSIVSLSIFIYAAYKLPRICLILLPIAAIWFYIYPFTKRFTYLSHLWLGIAIGGSVLGGYLASEGSITSPVPYILGIAVTLWVAGFDIIYACQDYEFDKEKKLKSIPSQFGIKTALDISKIFHCLAIFLLSMLGFLISASFIYWLGVLFVFAMLFYEQSLVKENDLSKVNLAFFTINGWVSIGFFFFIAFERKLGSLLP